MIKIEENSTNTFKFLLMLRIIISPRGSHCEYLPQALKILATPLHGGNEPHILDLTTTCTVTFPRKMVSSTNMAGGQVDPAGTHNVVVKQNMSNWQQDFSFSHSSQLRYFLLKKTHFKCAREERSKLPYLFEFLSVVCG